MTTALAHCADYEQHRGLAEAAVADGRLPEALTHLSSALQAARVHGDGELVDWALCAKAALAIELGDVEAPVPDLREIVLRNGNAETCALAARAIARAYELRKDYRKSLFYARVARDRAEQAESGERLAAANNQIGNALVAQCIFDEAAESYRRALRTIPEGRSEWRLICTVNLGYCELLQGNLRSGLRRIYATLREARRHGLQRVEMIARIDLCYAHLELRRYRDAQRYGARGLALAEEIGEVDLIKNALFLSGQVAVLLDDEPRGREIFAELQRRFYPGQPFLADLLVNVDVRPLINLRA
jgi:ATP/maltotriose-dependent transcriptional regulator MalT